MAVVAVATRVIGASTSRATVERTPSAPMTSEAETSVTVPPRSTATPRTRPSGPRSSPRTAAPGGGGEDRIEERPSRRHQAVDAETRLDGHLDALVVVVKGRRAQGRG